MMKKTLSFLFLSLPLAVLAQQNEFTVEANASRTLTSTERTLSLKKLNLGDNSTIIIPATMDGWTVTATDASIGHNVKIIGNGTDGANGGNGVNGSNAPANCQNGWNGVGGGFGSTSGKGKKCFIEPEDSRDRYINRRGNGR